MKISSNIVGDSNDENDFPHKFLLTNTQVSKLGWALVNNFLANTKLSKTQLYKIGQSGRFLGRLLRPLLKTRLPLMGNVLKPLAKSFLIPLGLTAAASATHAAIHKKIFGSGFTTLIISKEEIEDIMRIVKSVEESGSSIKGVSETVKNEGKEQNWGFFGMLLGTKGASLLGNLLTGKGTIRAGEVTIREGEKF